MKVCFVTGTRAEYGLLYPLLKRALKSKRLDVKLLVCGMHLSPEFGMTVSEIEDDGFTVDRKVNNLVGLDTRNAMVKSMGKGLIEFADAFEEINPDMVLVLGDRFEILTAATAAMGLGIPVIHLEGGHVTEGAIDDSMRHAITKMSYLHFTANEQNRQRIIQLGESPDRVFSVGSLGIDNTANEILSDKAELEAKYSFSFAQPTALITYHPVTNEHGQSQRHFENLLMALEQRSDLNVFFTMPNADPEGHSLGDIAKSFVQKHEGRAKFATSLGRHFYLSMLNTVDVVIGNSSSGLIEAPSLHTATLNIGNRQKGRLCAESVLTCEDDVCSILAGLNVVLSKDFQGRLSNVTNPYGDGRAAMRITETLEVFDINQVKPKAFYDLDRVGEGQA